MSKEETTSTQSLPVDEIEPSTSQLASDTDGVDAAAPDNGSDITSDPVSVSPASDTGASADNSSRMNVAAEAAQHSGSILGISTHVIVAIVAVIAVAAAVVVGVVATQKPAIDDWFDSNASQGQFVGKSQEEIQAALNEEVAKGMMNISIAASINFADGASEGEARIENIAANPMDQKVTITLKDSGDVVYESGALAPDQHIQSIKLTKDLEPGAYNAIATFTGYDKETHKQTGQAAAEIVLHVEG